MSYPKNIKSYIEHKDIRLSFVSMRTGISEEDMKEVLSESTEADEQSLINIANVLGQELDFFVDEKFVQWKEKDEMRKREPFNKNGLTKKQEKYIQNLIELLDNVDEVLSARARFLNIF